jgi:hypothetical protein
MTARLLRTNTPYTTDWHRAGRLFRLSYISDRSCRLMRVRRAGGGGLLVLAGGYQLRPLKQMCLRR